jgi:hypothetical protein
MYFTFLSKAPMGLQTFRAIRAFQDRGRKRSGQEGFGLEIRRSLGTVPGEERAEDSRAESIRPRRDLRRDLSGRWPPAMRRAGRWSWRASIALILLLSLALWFGIARLVSAWLG